MSLMRLQIKYLIESIKNKKFWKNVDNIILIIPFISSFILFLIASTQRNLGITDWYQHAIMLIGSLIVYFLLNSIARYKEIILPSIFANFNALMYTIVEHPH